MLFWFAVTAWTIGITCSGLVVVLIYLGIETMVEGTH